MQTETENTTEKELIESAVVKIEQKLYENKVDSEDHFAVALEYFWPR